MGRRLYLFVDESGNHSQRDCYTVAACWCVTEYDDPNAILKPTVRRIQADIVGEEGAELKGEEMDAQTLTSTFQYMVGILTDDETIDAFNLPWGSGRAIGYTLYDSDSDLGIAISEEYLGESRSGTTPQLLALASVVSPLLRMDGPDHAPIDSRHVLLDATTWERARHKLSRILDQIEWVPEIFFETRHSHTTPGIQLADLAAHLRRRYIVGSADGNAELIEMSI